MKLRRRHVIASSLLVLLLVAPLSIASATNAAFYLNDCRQMLDRTSDPTYYQGICTGVISTVMRLSTVLKKEAEFCLPSNANVFSATLAVLKYANEKPELTDKHELADIVLFALSSEWPCKK